MYDDMDDGGLQMAQTTFRAVYEVSFICPFCGKSHCKQNAPDGCDIPCCGEIGHCEPETQDER